MHCTHIVNTWGIYLHSIRFCLLCDDDVDNRMIMTISYWQYYLFFSCCISPEDIYLFYLFYLISRLFNNISVFLYIFIKNFSLIDNVTDGVAAFFE